MNQQLPKSIKLKLEQPNIICSGRKRIECYYKGKIIKESPNLLLIEFKSKGDKVTLLYNKIEKQFIETINAQNVNWQDLKIVE